MWFREYRDYKIDSSTKKEQLSSGRGIIGCEMHDLNGWGEEYHIATPKKKKGVFASLLEVLFPKSKQME